MGGTTYTVDMIPPFAEIITGALGALKFRVWFETQETTRENILSIAPVYARSSSGVWDDGDGHKAIPIDLRNYLIISCMSP